jgi:hypothetical protein
MSASATAVAPPAVPWNLGAGFLAKLEGLLDARIGYVDNQLGHNFSKPAQMSNSSATAACDARRNTPSKATTMEAACMELGRSGLLAARCGEIALLTMEAIVAAATTGGKDVLVALINIGSAGGHAGNHSFVLCSSNGAGGAAAFAAVLAASPVLVPLADVPPWGGNVIVFDYWVDLGKMNPFATTSGNAARWRGWLEHVEAQAKDACITHCRAGGANLPLSVAFCKRIAGGAAVKLDGSAIAPPTAPTGGDGGGGGGCCIVM